MLNELIYAKYVENGIDLGGAVGEFYFKDSRGRYRW